MFFNFIDLTKWNVGQFFLHIFYNIVLNVIINYESFGSILIWSGSFNSRRGGGDSGVSVGLFFIGGEELIGVPLFDGVFSRLLLGVDMLIETLLLVVTIRVSSSSSLGRGPMKYQRPFALYISSSFVSSSVCLISSSSSSYSSSFSAAELWATREIVCVPLKGL